MGSVAVFLQILPDFQAAMLIIEVVVTDVSDYLHTE
jgi:hypothetical protein